MTVLLRIREAIRDFYARFEVYITPVIKFVMALVTFLLINSSLGYWGKLSSKALALVVALLCSFLPMNFMILFATVFVLAHLYKLSLEIMIFVLAIFLLMYLLFFRFSPRDTFAVLLTPVCFVLKIPYVIPLVLGLVGTPYSLVSVSCGCVSYYLLHFVHENSEAILAMDKDGSLTRFKYIVDGFMHDRKMVVMIFAMIVCILVTYYVRRLSLDYSWQIAIGCGALSHLAALFLGDLMFKAYFSVPMAFCSMIVCVLIAFVVQFMLFNLDYRKTEKVQFEDDEYYYYVKAVPKKLSEKEK